MKILLMLGVAFFCLTGCFQSDTNSEDLIQIDHITIEDSRSGEVITSYSYDVLNGEFIGEAPSSRTTIKGDRVSSTPNNHGGNNVRCRLSNATCYENM